MTSAILSALDLTPTVLFWLAVPVVLYFGYWLAPWVSSQRKKGGR
jgi:hypothetical protein